MTIYDRYSGVGILALLASACVCVCCVHLFCSEDVWLWIGNNVEFAECTMTEYEKTDDYVCQMLLIIKLRKLRVTMSVVQYPYRI